MEQSAPSSHKQQCYRGAWLLGEERLPADSKILGESWCIIEKEQAISHFL